MFDFIFEYLLPASDIREVASLFNERNLLSLVTCIFGAFLIGGIPIGYLVGRCYGVDIRMQGSRNIGATNVQRTLGKSAGFITLAGDIGKGIAAIYIPYALGYIDIHVNLLKPLMGIIAILGHCFSPFLSFQGGKGVATSIGVFLVLTPGPAILSILVFLFVTAVSRYISLGSVIGAAVLPFLAYFYGYGDTRLLVSICAAALIIWRHKKNIERLLTGTENRFKF